MTTATTSGKAAWQVQVKWEERSGTRTKRARKGEIVETPDGELIKAMGTETIEKDYDFRVRVVHLFQPDSDRHCDRIRFQINEQNGPAITFSDARERNAGTAGVTGIWGTLPAPPPVKPRPLSLAAFGAELSRFVGAEQAEEVIQTIRSDFFRPYYDKRQTLGTPWRVRRSPSTTRTMP
jgi:hypothetical protein